MVLFCITQTDRQRDYSINVYSISDYNDSTGVSIVTAVLKYSVFVSDGDVTVNVTNIQKDSQRSYF